MYTIYIVYIYIYREWSMICEDPMHVLLLESGDCSIRVYLPHAGKVTVLLEYTDLL